MASTAVPERDSSWQSALLQHFDGIRLSEMGHVVPLRRTDTKYLNMNCDLLLADLRERTGLPVTRSEIGRIDFLRDVAEL